MILIVDTNSEALARSQFVDPLVRIAKQASEVTVIHYKDMKRASLDGITHIILSGTPLKDNDFLEHLESFGWVRTARIPILGICAGMQVLAALRGCRIVKGLEIGMTRIATLKDNPLFSGEFEAYSLHGSSIEPSDQVEVLATSGEQVQAIRHNDHFGVLFHPEARNAQIILNFLNVPTTGQAE